MHASETLCRNSQAHARTSVVALTISCTTLSLFEFAIEQNNHPLVRLVAKTLLPVVLCIIAIAFVKLKDKQMASSVDTLTLAGTTHEKAFSVFIAVVNVVGCCAHLYLAALYGALSTSNATERVAIKSIENGSIPLNVVLCLILPCITTPCGMDLDLAKSTSKFSLAVFCLSVFATYQRVVSVSAGEDCHDRLLNLLNDAIFALVATGIAYCTCVPESEASRKFVDVLKAEREADSVLNHVLKNTIAGASCLIELDQDDQEYNNNNNNNDNNNNNNNNDNNNDNDGGSPEGGMQQQALEQLQTAMRWCSSRQSIMDLAAGQYKSSLSPVSIESFLREFEGRGHAAQSVTTNNSVPATQSIKTDTGGEEGLVEVLFDEKMARLAMENAVTNALTHGEDGGGISIKANFVAQEQDDLVGTSSVGGAVVFVVENRVSAGTALQSISSSSLLPDGGVVDVASMSREEEEEEDSSGEEDGCDDGGQQRHGSLSSLSRPPVLKPVIKRSSISTNSGLKHIGISCKGAGGSFDLRSSRDSRSALMTITLPAHLAPVATPTSTTVSSFDTADNPIQVCADEKAAARIRSASDNSSDSSDFSSPEGILRARPLFQRKKSPSSVSEFHKSIDILEGLKICAIDDSSIICKGYKRLLFPLLKANMEESAVVCPTRKCDADNFLDIAAPPASAQARAPEDYPDPADIAAAADVAILDQNIDFKEEGNATTVLGTDLALELRARDFAGLILIRSGNASAEDLQNYMRGQAVDGCIGKDGSHAEMAQSIRDAYASKAEQRALSELLYDEDEHLLSTLVVKEPHLPSRGQGYPPATQES